MRYLIFTLFVGLLILVLSFREGKTDKVANEIVVSTNDSGVQTTTSPIESFDQSQPTVQALSFVEYAKTLTGTPYLYGSTDPAKGLDCSGFVNAVSNHFGIKVPRSSGEFANVGITVEAEKAKPGDLVLFTGTDPLKRVVGHIGIITNNEEGHLQFIHSSSGKAHGVTTSELDEYYQSRFVKVIRIFPTSGDKIVG